MKLLKGSEFPSNKRSCKREQQVCKYSWEQSQEVEVEAWFKVGARKSAVLQVGSEGRKRGHRVADLGLGHCACHTRQPKAESTLSMLDPFSRSHCAQCCFGSAHTHLRSGLKLALLHSCWDLEHKFGKSVKRMLADFAEGQGASLHLHPVVCCICCVRSCCFCCI